MERTLVLLKPDAVQREYVGELIATFERRGLKIVGLKLKQLDDALLKEHYSHISDKPFFPEISSFMSSVPVVCLALEGIDAVEAVREMTGVTLSRKAAPGTIRGMGAMSLQCNLVHTSDSLGSAELELERFFSKDELFSYEKLLDQVVYSAGERS